MTNVDPAAIKPLLPQIDSPADLRALSPEQLPQVCQELRDMMIQSLSQNPGHFASSMGAVDLTVALHYVFNTPYDRIVWDVGHQAYAHKILTGRRDSFDTLRKVGGLSGFPNPAESEYDTFIAGHASNSISAALGMAVAANLKQDEPRRNVVAVIGDASISGGLAFEGINNAANTPNNLLIILNDNDMSIDRPVGSLNSHLAHMTTSRIYNDIRYKLFKLMRRTGLITDRRRGALLRFNNSLKSLLSRQQNIFEGLNIRYFGPFNGNDVATVVRVLNDIRDMNGPRILHLRTVKGYGYAAAEADPTTWHAPGCFDPTTGERIKKAGKKKYQDVFGDALLELANADKRIVAITAAMPSGTSVSTMQRELPDRTFDVGISEGHAVTFASGLAKEGMRPTVAIYSSFLQRAYDQVIHDAAIQNLPVTLCIDRAGIVGEDGVTHHGVFDMASLRPVPNITIAAPSDGAMLQSLMATAAGRDSGVWAIRYPRGGADNAPTTPMSEAPLLPVGKGRTVREGTDVVIVSIGPRLSAAEEAAKALASEGISALVVDLIFLKPIDSELIDKIAAMHRPVVTVEDASADGGMGSAVAEELAARGFDRTVTRLGIPDSFVTQGTPAELYHQCGIDAGGIADAVRQAITAKQPKS